MKQLFTWKTAVKTELMVVMAVYLMKFVCTQRLEELSVASSRLENEVKYIRRAACVNSGEVIYPPQQQDVTRPQQQQQVRTR